MKPQDLFSLDGLRIDGRRPEEIRRVSVQLGVVPGADGSALVEQGQTRVLVAVYGPYEANKSSGTSSATQPLIADALRTAAAEYEAMLSSELSRTSAARSVVGATYNERDEDESSEGDAPVAGEYEQRTPENKAESFESAQAMGPSQRLLPPATAQGRIRCEYSVASFAAATASVRSLRAYRRRQRNQDRPFMTTLKQRASVETNEAPERNPEIGTRLERNDPRRPFAASLNSKFRQKSREAAAQIRDIFEAVVLVGGDTNSAGSSRYMPPHAQIDVFVQVLQSDGGDLAVAVNAVSLALSHAAVPLRDMVIACTAAALPTEEVASKTQRFVTVTDPTDWELHQARLWRMAAGAAIPEATAVVLAGKSFQPYPRKLIEGRKPDSLYLNPDYEAQLLWLDYRNMAMEARHAESIGHDPAWAEQAAQVLTMACTTGCNQTYRMLREAALTQMHHHLLRYEWSAAYLRLAKTQQRDEATPAW